MRPRPSDHAMGNSLDRLCNIETTIESSMITLGIRNHKFALLLHQEVWSASVVTKLERADDEGFVSEELVAPLRVLAKVTCRDSHFSINTRHGEYTHTSHMPFKVFGLSLRHRVPELWCSRMNIIDGVQVHLSRWDS